jgi:glutamate/tyrosine decarboxylase-like PLP-dependent enzyme
MSGRAAGPPEESADLLRRAARAAQGYLDGLPARRVGEGASMEELRRTLGVDLTDEGVAPAAVIDALAAAAEPGLVASSGPRYFGFVNGGSLPVALAADWLVSAWDQNAGLYATSPAAAVVEEVAAGWVLELLALPPGASVGFVTGGQMANFSCLAAARHAVLARVGWDVERDGLHGAPRVEILVGEHAHATILAALKLLGLGTAGVAVIAADEQGRMRADELERALHEGEGPAIVCAQAGEVNTGACDPFERIADASGARGAWLHVDGAFGLWAAAAPDRRHLVAGVERADSWGTDAHKWLNVPYDAGLAIVRDPQAHRAALAFTAAYLASSEGRDPHTFVPEASRRARGIPIYAALRSLGRLGVAELVERCCRLAQLMADALAADVEVVNEVVLNQVLVAVGDADLTARVIARIRADGTCWLGGTTFRGRPAIRISVVGWSTSPHDVRRSATAIVAAVRAERHKAESRKQKAG